MHRIVIGTLALALGLSTSLVAQDKAAVAKQNESAMASLKRAGFKKLSSAESKSLLVISSLDESKAQSIAEAAQKTFDFTHKELKLDSMLWPGKLTLLFFGDNRELSAYIRVVTQRRPDARDWFAINVRGDAPTAAVMVEATPKTKDAELHAAASTIVAAALLNKKAGTSPTTGSLPEWLQIGFGKLMLTRATGGSTLADYRSKSRTLVVGTRTRPSPVRMAEVWSGVRSKESELVAMSLVEYMMYGTEGDKFASFAGGFKNDENGNAPTIDSVFSTLEWKMDEFELGWKVWVSKQK